MLGAARSTRVSSPPLGSHPMLIHTAQSPPLPGAPRHPAPHPVDSVQEAGALCPSRHLLSPPPTQAQPPSKPPGPWPHLADGCRWVHPHSLSAVDTSGHISATWGQPGWEGLSQNLWLFHARWQEHPALAWTLEALRVAGFGGGGTEGVLWLGSALSPQLGSRGPGCVEIALGQRQGAPWRRRAPLLAASQGCSLHLGRPGPRTPGGTLDSRPVPALNPNTGLLQGHRATRGP